MGHDAGSPAQLAKMPEPPEQETACKPLPLVAAPEDFCLIFNSTCQLRKLSTWMLTSVLFFLSSPSSFSPSSLLPMASGAVLPNS